MSGNFAIKGGGGGGPPMANAILNFHFDFLTPSLMNIVTSAVFDLHHCASYFLYIRSRFTKKTLSKGKDDGGRPGCVLCMYAGSDVLG